MTEFNKVKGYRYMLGLTQKEMGNRLGISKETYIIVRKLYLEIYYYHYFQILQ